MRNLARIVVLSVAALTCSAGFADVYHFTPNPADLNDLDHTRYYTWGINKPWAADQIAVSAKLSFSQIYDWTSEPNVLYVHQLDTAPLGVTSYTDNEAGGDNFADQGGLLVTYTNLPTTPQNLSYTFSSANLLTLNLNALDGRFALGFDPDCHFYNCGVALDITTAQGTIPEPATLVILLVGAVGALHRRFARR